MDARMSCQCACCKRPVERNGWAPGSARWAPTATLSAHEAKLMHILRNPHGWSAEAARAARLWAADEIERLRGGGS